MDNQTNKKTYDFSLEIDVKSTRKKTIDNVSNDFFTSATVNYHYLDTDVNVSIEESNSMFLGYFEFILDDK